MQAASSWGSVEDLSLADWRRAICVNADSMLQGAKCASPLTRESQPRSIINLSQIAGIIASHNLAVYYNASKAGGLIKSASPWRCTERRFRLNDWENRVMWQSRSIILPPTKAVS